jgi:hypothetical protein
MAAPMSVKPAEVLAKVLRSYLDNKRFLALLAIGTGGVATVAATQLAALRTQSKSDRAASAAVLKGRADSHKRSGPKPPAVDRVFLERLLFVLRIAVPSWHSQEAFMLATQSVVLVSRSLLSLRMARIGGNGLKARPLRRGATQPAKVVAAAVAQRGAHRGWCIARLARARWARGGARGLSCHAASALVALTLSLAPRRRRWCTRAGTSSPCVSPTSSSPAWRRRW